MNATDTIIAQWGVPGALLVIVGGFAFVLYRKYCQVQEARIAEMRAVSDKILEFTTQFKAVLTEMSRSVDGLKNAVDAATDALKDGMRDVRDELKEERRGKQ